jgi:hypothetical protein
VLRHKLITPAICFQIQIAEEALTGETRPIDLLNSIVYNFAECLRCASHLHRCQPAQPATSQEAATKLPPRNPARHRFPKQLSAQPSPVSRPFKPCSNLCLLEIQL